MLDDISQVIESRLAEDSRNKQIFDSKIVYNTLIRQKHTFNSVESNRTIFNINFNRG